LCACRKTLRRSVNKSYDKIDAI